MEAGGAGGEDDVAFRKRALRTELLRRRRELPGRIRREAAARVASAFTADRRVREARRVGIYAATVYELPTRPTFDRLREQRAEVLLPRLAGAGLEFAPIAQWTELEPGPFRVLAPPPERTAVALGPEDVVLVPGVAFDEQGGRLGRGGGHYDRSFPLDAGPWLVGAAFECQLVAWVPRHSRDRSMDAIVTERGLRRVSSSASGTP